MKSIKSDQVKYPKELYCKPYTLNLLPSVKTSFP